MLSYLNLFSKRLGFSRKFLFKIGTWQDVIGQFNPQFINFRILYSKPPFLKLDVYFQNIEEECLSNLCGNGFNRWFDKSVTIPVYENGVGGGNVEHTAADATVNECHYKFIQVL